MFGNRKRKSEDDESLVPHGLIWHATAEPTPEEVTKNEELLGHTLQYAQGIEQARRQHSVPESNQTTDAVPQVASAASAPLPWWRVQQAKPEPDRPISKPALLPLSAYVSTQPVEPETPRLPKVPPSRIQPMEIRPAQIQPIQVQPIQVQPIQVQPIQVQPTHVQPIQSQVIPVPEAGPAKIFPRTEIADSKTHVPESAKLQLYKADVNNIAAAVPKSNANVEALLRAASWLQSSGKTAWLSALSVSGKVRERGLKVSKSISFRQSIIRAGRQGQSLMQSAMARSSHYARTTGSVLSVFRRDGVARWQRVSARVSSASATTDVVRPANTQPSAPSRVRVLLAESVGWAKLMTERQLSGWKVRRNGMAIDSRFWTSMTMAAIAALIVLGIVSVVPHYAANSLPSRTLNTNPSVSANAGAPTAASSPRVEKTAARKTGHEQPAQQKTASTNTATTAKSRRAVDDDYVAPDTYKYYGNGSKASGSKATGSKASR